MSDETFFHKWLEVPPELKMVIVGHLDYRTRMKLARCSRQDYEVVKSTPIPIYSMSMSDEMCHEINDEVVDTITVHIAFDRREGNTILVEFLDNQNDTTVFYGSKRDAREMTLLSSCNFYEEAVKFVESWMKKARHNVKKLHFSMERYPTEKSEIAILSQCRELSLSSHDETLLRWLLEKVPPKLDVLQFVSSIKSLSPELLSMNHFKMAQSYSHTYYAHSITDEQFLSLHANYITIDDSSNRQVDGIQPISDRAINRFIREWVNGSERDHFKCFVIRLDRIFVEEDILKDIIVRNWDEVLERETALFSSQWDLEMNPGNRYRIYKNDGSGTSASLNFSRRRVLFAVTGKTVIDSEGRTQEIFSFPRFKHDFTIM